MGVLSVFDRLGSWLRRRNQRKLLTLARTWPTTTGEINHWKVVPADYDTGSFANTWQIEATFHFLLNGDYYGGYLRSTAMPHPEAQALATGSPTLTLRYNPAHPDTTAALPEENPTLPFQIHTTPHSPSS